MDLDPMQKKTGLKKILFLLLVTQVVGSKIMNHYIISIVHLTHGNPCKSKAIIYGYIIWAYFP